MQQRFQEKEYWKHRWANHHTGWNLSPPHSTLVEHIETIAPHSFEGFHSGIPSATVFVPLCGRTLDIHWLRDEGYAVIGCETSDEALKELFEELEVKPNIYTEYTTQGTQVEVWETKLIKIYHASFFALGRIPVDAVFDRASLISLPGKDRPAYTTHMMAITNCAPQIVIAYEHARNNDPNYAVPYELMLSYYGMQYLVEPLSHRMDEGGVMEDAYLLTRK